MLKFFRNVFLIRTLIGLLIMISLASIRIIDIAAQSNSEDWSSPINLSNSGSTTNPQLVVDSNGIFHAIWVETFDDYNYVQSSDGEQWSTPGLLSPPFTVEDSPPLLIPDRSGNVHAFWMDEDNILYYSRVPGSEFGNAAFWQAPIILAESSLDLDAIVDSRGILHLSYVRPLSSEQFPSGIYYRSSTDNGQSWSDPTSLYQSKYFRSITRKDAHVQVSSTILNGEEFIYVAWDNRPDRRVFMVNSLDGGISWQSVREVEGPSVDPGITPFNIILSPQGSSVLSLIQRGEPGSYCTQVYSYSTDQGATWSITQPIYQEVVGCPQDIRYFVLDNGITILHSIIQDQVYLMAWDGERWSDPQKQLALFNFLDQFHNQSVDYSCRKMIMVDERLYVIGCDLNEYGDIWTMSRLIGSNTEWFTQTTDWSQPSVITTYSNVINEPIVLADSKGIFHAIWLQSLGDQLGVSISYSRLSDNVWLVPVTVLVTSDNNTSSLSAIIDNRDRILTTWSDQKSGSVYFSWASVEHAATPSEWSEPRIISSSNYYNTSPSIAVDDTGKIIIVFVVPINEGRGIYLTQSEDGGDSWSQLSLVVDATLEGWEIVSSPKILATQNRIHLIWTRNSLSNESKAIELYYSSSDSDGITWTKPSLIVESTPLWFDIKSGNESEIHQMWFEIVDNHLLFSDQISEDLGNTWNPPVNISNFSTENGVIDLTKDSANSLHLIQLGEDNQDRRKMSHWSWHGQEWSFIDEIDIDTAPDNYVRSLSTTTNPEGRLAIVYMTSNDNMPDVEPFYNLYFMSKQLLLPLLVPTINPQTNDQIPTITPSPTATTTIEPIITADIESTEISLISNDLQQPPTRNNNQAGFIIGVILAIIVITIPIGLYARTYFRRRNQ